MRRFIKTYRSALRKQVIQIYRVCEFLAERGQPTCKMKSWGRGQPIAGELRTPRKRSPAQLQVPGNTSRGEPLPQKEVPKMAKTKLPQSRSMDAPPWKPHRRSPGVHSAAHSFLDPCKTSEVALCLYSVHFWRVSQQQTENMRICVEQQHPFSLPLVPKQRGTPNHLASI